MQKMKSCAILLAAGEGSRMGYTPKSLLTYRGENFLHGQIRSLRQAGIESIHVVTGFYCQQIENALADQPVNILRNPHPEAGQQSSVSLALTSIGQDNELVMIALADQPLINAQDLGELIQAFAHRSAGKEILYPVVRGQRGNPVLISGQAHALYLRQAANMTCREWIDSQPELVQRLQSDNTHFIVDIDTPEDLNRLDAPPA